MKVKLIDHIGAILLGMLVLELVGCIAWTKYRYGGEYYYMKVGRSIGTHVVTVPISYSVNAYIYRGVAKDTQGHEKKVTLKADSVDPGPFKKGSVVRLTINKKYGITNYKIINRKRAIFDF